LYYDSRNINVIFCLLDCCYPPLVIIFLQRFTVWLCGSDCRSVRSSVGSFVPKMVQFTSTKESNVPIPGAGIPVPRTAHFVD